MAYKALVKFNGMFVVNHNNTGTYQHTYEVYAPLGYKLVSGALIVNLSNNTQLTFSFDKGTVTPDSHKISWTKTTYSSVKVTSVDSASTITIEEDDVSYNLTTNIPSDTISICTYATGKTNFFVFNEDDRDVTYSGTDSDGNNIDGTLDYYAIGLHSLASDINLDTAKEITLKQAIPSSLIVTNNITNSEYSVSGSNPYTFVVTSNSGYIFNETPTITYKNPDGETETANFQLSSDNKTATIDNVSLYADDMNVTLNGSTSEETIEPTFTNNIPHTTLQYSGSNHQYTVKITADEGYLLSGEITAEYIGYSTDNTVSVTFAVSSDNKTANGVCPDVDENTPVVISGSTVTEYVNITQNLTNCTSNVGDSVKRNESVSITLTANDNAEFSGTTPKIQYLDSGLPTFIDFVVSEDKKTANVTYTPDRNFTINAVAHIIEPVGVDYGSINVYVVTLENLDDFSKKRFFKETQTDESVEQIDLGVYVNRLKRVFVNVPVSGDDVIKCGNYNIGISCQAPKTDIVTLDFGYLTITGVNANSHDYDSTLQIFLPFVGFVSIDKSFIDKTINLTYKVNIITGNGVAIISYSGTPVILQDVSVSRDVLYKTSSYTQQTVGSDSFDENSLYGFEPYVLMNYTNTQLLGQHKANEDVIVGDIVGLAQFENVNVNVNCLVSEQKEIQSLLNSGVIL